MSIQTTATRYFERLHDFDKLVCQRFNRVCELRGWVNLFRIVSRLGELYREVIRQQARSDENYFLQTDTGKE